MDGDVSDIGTSSKYFANDRQRERERACGKEEKGICVCQVPCEEYIYAIPSMLIDLICRGCWVLELEDKNDDDSVVLAQTLRVLKIDEVHIRSMYIIS